MTSDCNAYIFMYCILFSYKLFPRGHGPSNITLWRSAFEPYLVTIRFLFSKTEFLKVFFFKNSSLYECNARLYRTATSY